MSSLKFTLLMISMLFISNVFCQKIVEDENVEQRILNSSFTTLKIHGSLRVFLSQDAIESVAVSANNVRDRAGIRTEVRDGVLFISGGRGKGKARPRVYMSFKKLESLEISGLTSLDVIGSIQQSQFDLSASGLCEFSGAVAVSRMEVAASGSAKIDLSGKAEIATLNASGTSDISAGNLQTEQCTILASGTSNIKIAVNDELTVKASGASDIIYLGSPAISQQLEGVSTVSRAKTD